MQSLDVVVFGQHIIFVNSVSEPDGLKIVFTFVFDVSVKIVAVYIFTDRRNAENGSKSRCSCADEA